VDDQLVAFRRDEHDQFEEVRCTVRADHEPTVRVVAEVIGDRRVLDSMEHVVVGDAMTASGRVDLHTPILYYDS